MTSKRTKAEDDKFFAELAEINRQSARYIDEGFNECIVTLNGCNRFSAINQSFRGATYVERDAIAHRVLLANHYLLTYDSGEGVARWNHADVPEELRHWG